VKASIYGSKIEFDDGFPKKSLYTKKRTIQVPCAFQSLQNENEEMLPLDVLWCKNGRIIQQTQLTRSPKLDAFFSNKDYAESIAWCKRFQHESKVEKPCQIYPCRAPLPKYVSQGFITPSHCCLHDIEFIFKLNY
jgi:hypothetical protein